MGRKKLPNKKSINKTFRVDKDLSRLIDVSGISWADVARRAVREAAVESLGKAREFGFVDDVCIEVEKGGGDGST